MSNINYQALREVAEAAKGKTTWQNLQAFHAVVTPETVIALLDVLDTPQDAKPVASCIVEDGCMCIDGFGEYVGHSLPDGTHQLYTAPPAPNGMQAHGIEIAINELVALSPRLDKRAVETLSMAVEHLRKLVKKQLQTKD
ncbi:ead/Ea22-like family protein [Escherichia coli]